MLLKVTSAKVTSAAANRIQRDLDMMRTPDAGRGGTEIIIQTPGDRNRAECSTGVQGGPCGSNSCAAHHHGRSGRWVAKRTTAREIRCGGSRRRPRFAGLPGG